MNEKINKIITVEEVMEQLNISSKKTIYTYINQGKLTPINKDDWHIEGRYEFILEDVLKLQEELKKPGLTTREVAEDLNVSITTVNKYIKQGLISAVQAEYRGIIYNFVTRDDLDSFKENHEIGRKPSKRHFYSAKDNVGLFHLFIKKTEEKVTYARIMEVESTIIGVTDQHEELTLEELRERGFTPAYELTPLKPITKEGYATFRFKKPAFIKAGTYQLIDLLYQHLSPVNMRIEPQTGEDYYVIEIKPVLIKNQNPDIWELFQTALISGELKKRTRGIYIDSDLEIVRLKLTSEMKKRLIEKAKQENKSLEELLVLAAEHI